MLTRWLWLTLVILASWEGEIGKIMAPEIKEIFSEISSQLLARWSGITCHPRLRGRLRSGGLQLQTSLDKNVCETPPQWKNARHDGSHLLSQLWREPYWRIEVQAGMGKKQDPIYKITRAKRSGDAVQVVEHLLSKGEALS
jgi:hypothetical protein